MGRHSGMFREGFGSAEQLRALITRAIHSYELSHASAPLDTRALARDAEAMLGQLHRDGGHDGPTLRFAIAGGPARVSFCALRSLKTKRLPTRHPAARDVRFATPVRARGWSPAQDRW